MRILNVKNTCQKIGKGRTKLWELTKDGRFPKPVKIDGGIGYLEHEVDEWIAQRISAASRFALQPIRKAARDNVKNDPDLKKSLTVKKDSRAPKAVPTHVVGPDRKSPAVRRAHFKEFGTDPHEINGWHHPGEPARPFLTPAYEAHGKEAIKRFGEKIGPALEKQAAKLARKRGG